MLENNIPNYKYLYPQQKSIDSFHINNYEYIDKETHKNILKNMLCKVENLSLLLYEKKSYIKKENQIFYY